MATIKPLHLFDHGGRSLCGMMVWEHPDPQDGWYVDSGIAASRFVERHRRKAGFAFCRACLAEYDRSYAPLLALAEVG